MKKLTILSLIIFLSLGKIYSQEWAPVGSKWYYSDITWGLPSINSPRIIESISDTIINGKTCRKIHGNCSCGFMTIDNFMYYDSSKIFMYNFTTNNFHILYDFSAGIGESWTVVPPNAADSFQVIVDSVNSRVINSITYNIQNIRNVNFGSLWDFSGEVAGGVGNISFCFFPQYSFADPWSGDIRCFDDTYTIKKFDTIPCDTTIVYTSLVETVSEKHLIFFPNPVANSLTIETISKSLIEILNIEGRVLKELTTNETQTIIDLSNLSSGIYFIKAKTDKGITVKKFIKE
jgi:hypothetical protein